ncbi:MAG: hypothetical protein WAO20_15325 [Acidobacteriota bacterium]
MPPFLPGVEDPIDFSLKIAETEGFWVSDDARSLIYPHFDPRFDRWGDLLIPL